MDLKSESNDTLHSRTHLIQKDIFRLKISVWKTIYHPPGPPKQAGVSDIVKLIKRDKEVSIYYLKE